MMHGVHSLISPVMRRENPVRHKYHKVLRIIFLIYSLTVRMIWTTCGFSSAFGLMKGSKERRRKKNHAICLLRSERLLAYPRGPTIEQNINSELRTVRNAKNRVTVCKWRSFDAVVRRWTHCKFTAWLRSNVVRIQNCTQPTQTLL